MSAFFRRFANLEALKSVSKSNLLKLLSKSTNKKYLATRGLVLPTGAAGKLDYDALAAILLDPDAGMPTQLVHDLHLADEMATEPIMLGLLDEAPPGLLKFGGIDPTPADVALQLLLKDRKFLEEKCAEQSLHRSRSFRICQGSGTNKMLPTCTKSAQVLIPADLDEWFFKHRRGLKCRVSFFRRPKEGQLWILVQRGSAKRLQSTFDDGKSSSVLFRPGAFDLIVYYLDQDLLVIHTDTDTKGERDLYRNTVGKNLFGDENYFAPDGNYTLEPLLVVGVAALGCEGLEGIESVLLREIEIYRATGQGMFLRVKSPDVFADLEECHMTLPTALGTKAVLEVKFGDAERPRSVTIYPPSRDRFERDDDRAIMEPFFIKNGFYRNVSRQANAAS